MSKLNLSRFAALAALVLTVETSFAAVIDVLSENNQISTFDSFTPQNVREYTYSVPVNANDTLVALVSSIATERQFYGVGSSGQFYRIRFQSMGIPSIEPLRCIPLGTANSGALAGSNCGLDLIPTNNPNAPFPVAAKLVSDANENITFDLNSGEATVQPAINPASHIAAITYVDSPVPGQRKTLGLDYESNMLVSIDPDIGTVCNVGPVGLDFDNNVAMSYNADTLYAILRVQGISGLYILNGDTGAVQYSLGPLKNNIIAKDMTALTNNHFTVDKAAVKLNFKKPNSDSISISGTFEIPAIWEPEGKPFTVDVGGVKQTFVLDSKMKGQIGSSKLSLKLALVDGVAGPQTGTYKVKLAKGNFSEALSDEGLTNSDVNKESRTIWAGLTYYLGQTQRNIFSVEYSAKAGKSGKAK